LGIGDWGLGIGDWGLGIGHGEEAEGRGAGGRGENSSPFLPFSLLPCFFPSPQFNLIFENS
ncbi:hypothetical protein, partial [Nostoc sp. CALU 1950]|uniref:hypothetical protein n=1 Tax=Nostoc sp. CALU 1950 TaxID=3104321 RepID=UPI003EBA1D9E